MVTNARRRLILIVLAFHAAAWSATAFFAHAAYSGDRGLLAKREHKIRAFHLTTDIAQVQAEQMAWSRRIEQLRSAEIDQDLLDERVRAVLNGAHANDLILALPPK